MEKKKLIPYGVTDFERIVGNNFYYVDKTMFIPELEDSSFVFFLRPRRFGKSLFVSMLSNYYDLSKKDRFEEIFKDTWIYANKTKDQGKYLVLSFNFSNSFNKIGNYEERFNQACNDDIEKFINK
jgi:hypothetical protein